MKTEDKVGLLVAVATAATGVIFVWQYQKYGMLNALAVAVGVQDATTKQPLQFASVQVGTLVEITDGTGEAVFTDVAKGSANVTVTLAGYEPVSQPVDISASSNSFLVSLKPL